MIGPRGRARRGEAWGALTVLTRDEALAGAAPPCGETAAILTAADEAAGLETARVMLHRAGAPLDVVLVHGCRPEEAVAVTDALARRLEAGVLVLAAAPAFAAQDWAARAAAALSNGRALALETGGAAAVAVDRAWAAGRLGGPVLRPGAPRPTAMAELLDAARAEGVLVRDPAAVLLDLDPPPDGPPQPGARVEVVDARGTDALSPGEPGVTAVVLPCIDVDRGRAAAGRLARRAGVPARVVVALDPERRGFVATLNAVAPHLAARRLAYVAEDAFPGPDWLARGLAALDAGGARFLGFNCGKWSGRIAAFGLMELDWARGLYDGAVMHPRYRAHRADNELTVIARARGVYAYEPRAIVMEGDARKALRPREEGPSGQDPGDRDLFRRRFRGGFGGLAPRGALAALAPHYFGPRRAEALVSALRG